jgi:hypothetical protein
MFIPAVGDAKELQGDLGVQCLAFDGDLLRGQVNVNMG